MTIANYRRTQNGKWWLFSLCIQLLAHCIRMRWMTICNYNMCKLSVWIELPVICPTDNSNLLACVAIEIDRSDLFFFVCIFNRSKLANCSWSWVMMLSKSILRNKTNRISLIFRHSFGTVACLTRKIEKFTYEQLTRFMPLTVQRRTLEWFSHLEAHSDNADALHVAKW